METPPLALLLAVGLTLTLSGLGQRVVPESMDELCMGCICEAATRCNRTLQCSNGVCGLFAITRPYWQDAGSPVIAGDSKNRKGAFERCVTEPFCAARAVQEYMARYSQDCDGNGVIDCHDMATLHQLGRGCEGTMSQEYMREFRHCERKVRPANV